MHVVELVLAGIGLIGLAIAALGISNAMLAAIRERRREIGVLKAVGATDRDVRRVFLVEAGTLGFVGGSLGAAIGFGHRGASWPASSTATCRARVCRWSISAFPLGLLAVVVGGATLLALAAGTLPGIARGSHAGPPGDRRRMNAKLLRAVAAISLAVVLASCAGRTHPGLTGSGVVSAKASTLVTIGSSATEGDGVPDRFRQAWPYLFFGDAFPVSTTLINAALDGATVANAQVEQLPLVRQAKPDVVAIWLGVDDLEQHTSVGHFSSGLQTLVAAIQAVGVRQVLVADIPSVYGSASSPYDDAIRPRRPDNQLHAR